MKKIVALLICMACTGCFEKSNDQIKSDALIAVKASIKEYNRSEPCKSLVEGKEALGSGSGVELMSLCGSVFDVSKPISFSDFRIHDAERQIACGVVSGESKAGSRLGVQFVYVGKRDDFVILKPSMQRYKNGQIPRVIEQYLELYQQTFNENCK